MLHWTLTLSFGWVLLALILMVASIVLWVIFRGTRSTGEFSSGYHAGKAKAEEKWDLSQRRDDNWDKEPGSEREKNKSVDEEDQV